MEPIELTTILQDILTPPPPICDNCFEVHSPGHFEDDRCAVRMLLTWADLDPEDAAVRATKISSSLLWDALHPVMKSMLAGEFDMDED
jgi:hypothetical protein